MENNPFLLLGISLGLGLLVGLQREYASSKTAGIRTFPLITLTGTICGLLAKELDGWIIVAGFLGVISLLVIGNSQKIKTKQEGSGITTEAAVLLMYALGAYLVLVNRSWLLFSPGLLPCYYILKPLYTAGLIRSGNRT